MYLAKWVLYSRVMNVSSTLMRVAVGLHCSEGKWQENKDPWPRITWVINPCHNPLSPISLMKDEKGSGSLIPVYEQVYLAVISARCSVLLLGEGEASVNTCHFIPMYLIKCCHLIPMYLIKCCHQNCQWAPPEVAGHLSSVLLPMLFNTAIQHPGIARLHLCWGISDSTRHGWPPSLALNLPLMVYKWPSPHSHCSEMTNMFSQHACSHIMYVYGEQQN